MRIAGYQDVSLIDFPGVISAVIFTQGCPFRCPYCHNPELIPRTSSHERTSEEVIGRLRRHRNMIEGVCITGGEPTIHRDLPDFLRLLRREGVLIKLDTNGVNPPMIERIIAERLVDYVAMDVKHTWEKYNLIVRSGNIRIGDRCRRTFEIIQEGGIPHEFRTTVYPGFHTEDDLLRIGAYFQSGERYVLQPIRYGKTLDPDLPRFPQLDLERVRLTIQERRPGVEVAVRE
ncbi:anaerobic ribonucleoside-triphosphate reductase activating protein [Candidatus Uhrbacteria bacterium]|nr:anaerobic ribonucleoside-triphosphate reductase activating protein [Candidatus Uhrbacteria bacterium]